MAGRRRGLAVHRLAEVAARPRDRNSRRGGSRRDRHRSRTRVRFRPKRGWCGLRLPVRDDLRRPATGMFAGPLLSRGLSRRRLMGLAIMAAGVSLSLNALMPNLLLAIVFTFLMGAFAGVVWVVGITLVGLEVSDDKRARTFAFIYNLMRLVLLAVVVAA